MKKVIFLVIGVGFFMFGSLVFSACAQNSPVAVVQNIDSKTFLNKMKEKNAIILDVRTPEEYAAGHIPNSVLIDYSAPDFKSKIEKLDKSKNYLVYCAAGGRSARASNVMVSGNFKSVYNLTGGFSQWNGPKE